jgi:hypothetical protein
MDTHKVSEPITALPESSTYTMSRNSLLSMLSTVRVEDIPMAIKYLVDKLSSARKNDVSDNTAHIWDGYQLSAEVIAMAPGQRKSIYGDYKEEIAELLEEKYR